MCFINSKKTHKKFFKIIKKNLLDKYLRIGYYTKIQTEALVENRYCRIVANLRDQIISNSPDEFLRRYYKYNEIAERVPKIAKYYRNYLLFFCKPVFTNLFINKLIHVYGELKGELYYNANYGNKNKDKENKDDNLKNDNINKDNFNRLQISQGNNKNKIKHADMLFNTTVKNDIDKNSMTISTIVKDISYLNMNPLNIDFYNNNALSIYNKNNTNGINQNLLNNNQLQSIRGDGHNAKNSNASKNFVNLFGSNINNKANYAGASINSNNNYNNQGNMTKRGATSKKKSENFIDQNNNGALNEKLSMNLKAELGNLFKNLMNANMNINNFNNSHNRNNPGNIYTKDGNKNNKKSINNISKIIILNEFL